MNGRLSLALALAALATAAQAEIHTRSSFTITIGNRPPPRVVVVEREAPSRVVYVERQAPRCHRPKVVYVEPRRECGPRRVVVIRDRRDAWRHRDRQGRFEHGGSGYDGPRSERFEPRSADQDLSSSDRDDRVAMDGETRSINR